MKNKRDRLFEGMYILSATLSKDAREKALEKITKGIEEKGGEIHKIIEMGKRKLAYEIRNKKEGFYYLIYFTLESLSIEKISTEYKLHEDLLRYMVLRASEVKESLEFPRKIKETQK
jgi:small subunit ribosomal protein S6